VESTEIILAEKEENKKLLLKKDTCDKYDYLIAAGCGAIGGIVDIFLVGAPGESVLVKWTDEQVDSVVKSFARTTGWNPRAGKEDSIASAIGHLEKTFKVNYDQRHTADVNNLFNMNTKNHHMMSLGHSPDILGLFFSILNQFTSTSSFIANGQLVTINTATMELEGGNIIAKLFCGVVNWLGHVMSDIAGSSGSRGNAGRGAGVVIPFYELFQFCKFGKFQVGQDRQDLATIAIRAFQEGYDARFGLAMAIPVLLTDLSIRVIWAIRQHFQYGRSFKDCIPTAKHADLRVMLLVGNGTFCVMDGADAAIRSGGNFLLFFTRINLLGWFRFISLVLKEICIRLEIAEGIEGRIESMKRVNEALTVYLAELEKIDIDLFKRETSEYARFAKMISEARTEEDMNRVLISVFEYHDIPLPWKGDFNSFMSDKNNHLVFE